MPILRLACPPESRGGSDLDRTRKRVARLAADPVEYLIMQTSTRLSSSICLFPFLPLCSVFAAPPHPPPPAFPFLLAATSFSLGPHFFQPYPPCIRQTPHISAHLSPHHPPLKPRRLHTASRFLLVSPARTIPGDQDIMREIRSPAQRLRGG